MKELTKAAVYVNIYNYENPLESIDEQIDLCNKYAIENGYEVGRYYIDDYNTAKRYEYEKMIADGKKRMFKVILVASMDRFEMNRYQREIDEEILYENGVNVVDVELMVAKYGFNVGEGMMKEMFDWQKKCYKEELKRARARRRKVVQEEKNESRNLCTI